jgi:hypothetical protein
MYITNHKQLIDNDRKNVTCTIDWLHKLYAQILVEDWKVFICQDAWEHIWSKDTLWYKYSLQVSEENNKYENSTSWVTDITISNN